MFQRLLLDCKGGHYTRSNQLTSTSLTLSKRSACLKIAALAGPRGEVHTANHYY